MKLEIGFVGCILIIVILGSIPSSDATIYQYQDGSNSNSEINEKLAWMENEIRKVVESGCSIQVESLATYIQTIWWPHIQYLASRVSSQEQQQTLIQYNRLLYMLGLKKCNSPYETWYQGRCYRIGIPGNPCPQYQQLYDKPDNTGYCYCQRNGANSNGLIYLDGQCYKQNEQGPCNNGQWLTVKDQQTTRCEQVPQDCPADGQHVYWGCNDGQTNCPNRRIQSNNQMKCSRIGSTQPTCGAGAKLIRNGMKTYCGSPKMMDRREPSVNMVLPSAVRTCPPPGNVQPIEEENNIVESSETNDEQEEDLFSDFNKIPIQPCPTGYYRSTADGGISCKEIPRSQMIRSIGQCPPGFRRDNRGQCRRMI